MSATLRMVTRSLGAALACSCLAPALLLAAEAGKYVGPTDVVASPDGKRLFVVAADAGQVMVVDVAGGNVTKTIACPTRPTGLAVAADGATLYVTCTGVQGTVCIVDVASGQISATIPVGHTPCAPVLLPDGKRLYVCNRFNNDVSVIDLETKQETARVKAIREPVATAVTPDGGLVFVTNLLPIDPADSYDVAAEVTVIDTALGDDHDPLAQRQFQRARRVRLARRKLRLRGPHPVPLPDAHHAVGTRLDEHQRDEHHRRGGEEALEHGAAGRHRPGRGQSLGRGDDRRRQVDLREPRRPTN